MTPVKTKHVCRANWLSLARGICTATAIAGLALVAPAHAARTSASRHGVQQGSKPFSFGGPPICAEEVAQNFRRSRTVDQHNLTPQRDFRLSVAEGKVQRVVELYNSFTVAAKNGSGPWATGHERVKMLQAALDAAAMTNRPAMIKRLIAYGSDPNLATKFPTMSAMAVAARCGNIAAMNMLYKLGANPAIPPFGGFFGGRPDKDVPDAIITAVRERQNVAVLWLLDHGVDVCKSKHESEIIMRYVKHPNSLGPLSNEVLKALRCPKIKTGQEKRPTKARKGGEQVLRKAVSGSLTRV